jgi:peptidoglycan L-alanyl-D-glutamate endopeptidase CwlK
VDVAPYPIDWEDYEKFYWFGGYIRWGGDWDGDGDFKDQTLVDLVHWEING